MKSSSAGCARNIADSISSPESKVHWTEDEEAQRGDSSRLDGRYVRHPLSGGPGEALPGRGDPGSRRWPDDLGGHLQGQRVKGYWGSDRLRVPFKTTLDWTIIARRCMGTKPVPMAPNFHVDITGLKSSVKLRKLFKVQAASFKPQAQASSSKPQATSSRTTAPS